jgi:hypothetical protein
MRYASVSMFVTLSTLWHGLGAGPAPPSTGFYPGAFVGNGSLAHFDAQTGVSHAIFHMFFDFPMYVLDA